jgi:hypothetical protein
MPQVEHIKSFPHRCREPDIHSHASRHVCTASSPQPTVFAQLLSEIATIVLVATQPPKHLFRLKLVPRSNYSHLICYSATPECVV